MKHILFAATVLLAAQASGQISTCSPSFGLNSTVLGSNVTLQWSNALGTDQVVIDATGPTSSALQVRVAGSSGMAPSSYVVPTEDLAPGFYDWTVTALCISFTGLVTPALPSATATFLLLKPGCGTVTDADGNSYPTVLIGSDCWLAENLRTTTYADGTPIPLAPSITFGFEEGYTVYDEDAANGPIYGLLYAQSSAQSPRGICPAGWRFPSNEDWDALKSTLQGSAGGRMKTLDLWAAPNVGANNGSGFNAKPGGFATWKRRFDELSLSAYWWGANDRLNNRDGWTWTVKYNDLQLRKEKLDARLSGASVRCIKD